MHCVSIHGSHGRLTVHAPTGHIVEHHPDGDGYAGIAFFDPGPIARWSGDLDILAAGYWTHEGDYAEPLTMRLIARGQDMAFDDWVPMRLLTAR